MNCNFLFRGINCRPCRSLGWIRPRLPPPSSHTTPTLVSASVAGFVAEVLRFLSCQFPPPSTAHSLSLAIVFVFYAPFLLFCFALYLCVIFIYLFKTLRSCFALFQYVFSSSTLFYQSLCIRFHCSLRARTHSTLLGSTSILWSLDVLYELSAKYSHLLICQQGQGVAINWEKREGNGQWITHSAVPRGSHRVAWDNMQIPYSHLQIVKIEDRRAYPVPFLWLLYVNTVNT